jgi:hypothetical protein
MPDHEAQRIFEILDGMREDLASIRTTSRNLDKAVNGNGKPGLLDRMTVIEQRQLMCPARDAFSKGAISNRIGMAAVLVSLVSVIIAWFVK